MATTFTLSSNPKFPTGTTVGVYEATDWPGLNAGTPSGAPPGSTVTTAVTAANGTTAFTGLTEGHRYFAGANIGGWRYVAFAVSSSRGSRPFFGEFADQQYAIWNAEGEQFEGASGTGGGDPDAATGVKGVSKLSAAPAVASNPIAVGTNDARVTADGLPSAATVRTLGSGNQQAAAGNDARFPTTDEKDALVGTDGAPAAANPYVTDSDPRLAGGGFDTTGDYTLTGEWTFEGAEAAVVHAGKRAGDAEDLWQFRVGDPATDPDANDIAGLEVWHSDDGETGTLERIMRWDWVHDRLNVWGGVIARTSASAIRQYVDGDDTYRMKLGDDLSFQEQGSFALANNARLQIKTFNEIQTVRVTDEAGGTFTLALGAETTGQIPSDVDADAMRGFVQALASVGAGNVRVDSNDAGGTRYFIIEFVGALSQTAQSDLVADGTNLTAPGTVEVQPIQDGGGPLLDSPSYKGMKVARSANQFLGTIYARRVSLGEHDTNATIFWDPSDERVDIYDPLTDSRPDVRVGNLHADRYIIDGQQSTVGAAGGAAPQPATPSTYLILRGGDGNDYAVAGHAVS